MENFTPFSHFATDAIHVGQEPEQWNSMAVVPPISLATTFKQTAAGKHSGYEYVRSGNPTRNCLEKCLASLEGADHGLVFSSGLAATDAIIRMLNASEHVVCMDDVYGGTNRYFRKIIANHNIETTFVDATEAPNVTDALRPNTKIIWIETPTNPTLKLVDIQAVANIVKNQPNVLLVVDNTFSSSYFQRPIDFGADIVLHSLTKYMNGHSDVCMGSVTTSNKEVEEKLRFLQYAGGAVPSPFDCYLVNRGLKTLPVRMKEHMKNGLAVAKWLEDNPRVDSVKHPGLPSHPQYELGKKQMKGYSGMLCFYIRGGLKEADTFLASLKIFTLAESLGGFESLAEHPALMTHASVGEQEREILGIGDNFIRLSVGLEDVEDLIEDLDQALKVAIPKL